MAKPTVVPEQSWVYMNNGEVLGPWRVRQVWTEQLTSDPDVFSVEFHDQPPNWLTHRGYVTDVWMQNDRRWRYVGTGPARDLWSAYISRAGLTCGRGASCGHDHCAIVRRLREVFHEARQEARNLQTVNENQEERPEDAARRFAQEVLDLKEQLRAAQGFSDAYKRNAQRAVRELLRARTWRGFLSYRLRLLWLRWAERFDWLFENETQRES